MKFHSGLLVWLGIVVGVLAVFGNAYKDDDALLMVNNDMDQNCGCGWATPSICTGAGDGSRCFGVCCGKYKASTPVKPAQQSSLKQGCDCGWATSSACRGPGDGSKCFGVCCGKSNGSSPSNTPSTSGWKIAKTTRYWDCCKPSCAWKNNVPRMKSGPVRTCARNGQSTVHRDNKNICGGGGLPSYSYMCSDQQPFTRKGVLYGFAASNVDCCSCYELVFQNTALAGRKMIIQVTNKGGDLHDNHFDLQIPGGGFGIFDGCTKQFSTPASAWGKRYGGISSGSHCNKLPLALRKGCQWRFSDFKNADNPQVKFRQIICPAILTNISKCQLK